MRWNSCQTQGQLRGADLPLKKGKWQELYSYAIDGSQGVALAYINSKDGKQTVKFQDEDGNLTTANDYEKEIKKLFRTIYGKTNIIPK